MIKGNKKLLQENLKVAYNCQFRSLTTPYV